MRTKNPWPALFKAVAHNDVQEVKHLLAAGHNVNVQDALGNTPLMLTGNNIELACLLIQAGAQVNIQNKKGDFVLRLASYDFAKLLVEHGANVNLKNESGYSAILSSDSLKKIKLLLEHGAHINDANNWGENLLMVLANANQPNDEYRELLQNLSFLIDAGIDINAQDNQGNTALISACYEDNFVLARELLKLGADATIKNFDGQTALEYAIKASSNPCKQHKECIEQKEEVIRLIKKSIEVVSRINKQFYSELIALLNLSSECYHYLSQC